MNPQLAYPFPTGPSNSTNIKGDLIFISAWVKNVESLLEDVFEHINSSGNFPKLIKRPLLSISARFKRINQNEIYISEDNFPYLEANVLKILERSSELKSNIRSNDIDNELRKILSSLIKGIDSIERIFRRKLTKNLFGIPQKLNTITEQNIYEDLEKRILSHINNKIHKSNNQIDETISLVNKIEDRLLGINDRISAEFEQAVRNSNESSSYLEKKKKEIEDLVGIVSGAAIFGSYEEAAKDEKYWANFTRFVSVTLMLIIAWLVGQTIWSTADSELKWQTSILRLVSSLVLSVPAAYLAREADKHRAKYNDYKKTAMDLKSINPYTDSLPEDQKNTLKTEMANRLFNKSNNENLSSSYPIDLQALLLAIVEKINGNQTTVNKQGQNKK